MVTEAIKVESTSHRRAKVIVALIERPRLDQPDVLWWSIPHIEEYQYIVSDLSRERDRWLFLCKHRNGIRFTRGTLWCEGGEDWAGVKCVYLLWHPFQKAGLVFFAIFNY